MGHYYVRCHGKLTRKRVFRYIIPLQKQIKQILNIPKIWHFFRNPVTSKDGILHDINDGLYVRNHALNNDPRNFLKLSIYYDDVEIQNPLCSSQKYKLAMFYFQVLNIPVQFRSKLQTIFLYGICRSKHLTKFGFKNFIKNFTDSVEELQSQGLQMSIQGSQFLVKGTLVYAICDAPASGVLGGFNKSAQALRPCR